MPQPTYAELAAALREVADRIAGLDDHDIAQPSWAHFSISYGYSPARAVQTVPAVDAIAAAFGATAVTKVEGRGATRRAERVTRHEQGPLTVAARTSVPPPPLQRRTAAQMQAELDRLNNELAEAKHARAGTR